MSSVVKGVTKVFKSVSKVAGGLVSGVTGLIGMQQASEAEKEAKKIAKLNAANEAAQTAEAVKRMEAANARQQSLARARAAASGAGGTSTDIYMDALSKAGREEVDWLKEVGAVNYNKAIAEGRVAKNKATSSFWGSAVEAGTGLFSLFM